MARKATLRTGDPLAKGPTTRARILDEAIRVASVEGLSGLTVGRLAERTGMSKSGLFAHFDSKESIDVAVLTEAFARFRDQVVLPALREPRGEPRIRALIARWYDWATDEQSLPGGCMLTQAAVELDDQPGRARDVAAEAMRQWMEALRRAAQIAIDVGQFRAGLDPGLFAFQLHGIMLATSQTHRLLRTPGTAARMQHAVDALIGSARKPGRKGGDPSLLTAK